ncbi:unnamed protein product [Brachionus calyciflorus]|uniref:Uncharacterized protein n=1 Tax=Brachionus calyciflorus TaxID=104777 RepID=A0A814PI97_9BILA|nr:unnamed protein product [Brachionus calyciflorus]
MIGLSRLDLVKIVVDKTIVVSGPLDNIELNKKFSFLVLVFNDISGVVIKLFAVVSVVAICVEFDPRSSFVDDTNLFDVANFYVDSFIVYVIDVDACGLSLIVESETKSSCADNVVNLTVVDFSEVDRNLIVVVSIVSEHYEVEYCVNDVSLSCGVVFSVD